MTEAVDHLRLAQIMSPAFPIGAFAHSQGLEWAIASGRVSDAETLADWIGAVLAHGSARMDAILLAMARRPGADMGALRDLHDALIPSAGRAREAQELGRGVAALTGGHDDTPYVLALAQATRALDVPPAMVLALFLQGVAAQLVSVAVRFMPLGQAQGQWVLAGLAPLIAQVAGEATKAGEDDLCAFTPGADIAGMEQEWMETRIFRS